LRSGPDFHEVRVLADVVGAVAVAVEAAGGRVGLRGKIAGSGRRCRSRRRTGEVGEARDQSGEEPDAVERFLALLQERDARVGFASRASVPKKAPARLLIYPTGVLYIGCIMMNERLKASVENRLRRIEGQIAGIRRMVAEDRYCVDILTQTSAIVSALRGVEDLVMQNHLQTCVTDAIQGNDPAEKQEKIDELMSVIGKFRKHG
jgi:DNA-binding FrmR family transcriptional regulator